eukprot:scaffold701_cov102-Skeletonema_marinoi.AAC.1
MKIERKLDAIVLERTLLAPSAEDLTGGGVHVSQAVGLEKEVNHIPAKSEYPLNEVKRMAILRLQEFTDDDELCRISQRLSSWGSERARTLAKAYVTMGN